jgi:tetratricopeptide (TPR) repeat protein
MPRLAVCLSPHEPDKAADDFATHTEAANAYYQYGRLLQQMHAPVERVIVAWQQAVARNPKHVGALLELGTTLYQHDQEPTLALAAARQALAIEPENKWVYYILGTFHQRAGQLSEAQAMYEHALALDAIFTRVRRRLEAIEVSQ